MLATQKPLIVTTSTIDSSLKEMLENIKVFKEADILTLDAILNLDLNPELMIIILEDDLTKLIDIQSLRRRFNSTKMLVFTKNLSQTVLTYLYHIGINACLPTSINAQEIDDVITNINLQEIFVSESLREYLLKPHDSIFVKLSLKQMQINFLLLSQWNSSQISKKLNTPKTAVEKIIKNLFKKLAVNDLESLINLAVKDGLLNLKQFSSSNALPLELL